MKGRLPLINPTQIQNFQMHSHHRISTAFATHQRLPLERDISSYFKTVNFQKKNSSQGSGLKTIPGIQISNYAAPHFVRKVKGTACGIGYVQGRSQSIHRFGAVPTCFNLRKENNCSVFSRRTENLQVKPFSELSINSQKTGGQRSQNGPKRLLLSKPQNKERQSTTYSRENTTGEDTQFLRVASAALPLMPVPVHCPQFNFQEEKENNKEEKSTQNMLVLHIPQTRVECDIPFKEL